MSPGLVCCKKIWKIPNPTPDGPLLTPKPQFLCVCFSPFGEAQKAAAPKAQHILCAPPLASVCAFNFNFNDLNFN